MRHFRLRSLACAVVASWSSLGCGPVTRVVDVQVVQLDVTLRGSCATPGCDLEAFNQSAVYDSSWQFSAGWVDPQTGHLSDYGCGDANKPQPLARASTRLVMTDGGLGDSRVYAGALKEDHTLEVYSTSATDLSGQLYLVGMDLTVTGLATDHLAWQDGGVMAFRYAVSGVTARDGSSHTVTPGLMVEEVHTLSLQPAVVDFSYDAVCPAQHPSSGWY